MFVSIIEGDFLQFSQIKCLGATDELFHFLWPESREREREEEEYRDMAAEKGKANICSLLKHVFPDSREPDLV